MFIRKILAVLMCVCLVSFLTVCDSNSIGSSKNLSFDTGKLFSDANKKVNNKNITKKFGAVYMTLNNPYFVVLNNSIQNVVEKNGGKLITLDPQLDIKKQIFCVNDLIEQKVDAIFLNPADWIGITPALEAAKKAGIPVIAVDAPVFRDDLVTATVASDNGEAGRLCAENIVKRFGRNKKIQIAILEHPTAKSAVDRIKSFEDEIKKDSNYQIVAKQSSNGQLEQAMFQMERILNTNQDIDVVMALNDPSAIGAIAALKESKRLAGTLVYGIDGSEDALKLIKSGDLTATVMQYPKEIGRIAAATAFSVIDGKKTNHDIKVTVRLIDKSNVDNAEQ